ncbi:MAG: hypothetical protein K2K83_04345, partial [Rikenella sp.]|nr:hypothetical protein [Rikenella sp.]
HTAIRRQRQMGIRHNRGYGSGTLYYVGNSGFSWASAFTVTYAYRLYFSSDAVTPNDGGDRAYGFQLRCLQE